MNPTAETSDQWPAAAAQATLVAGIGIAILLLLLFMASSAAALALVLLSPLVMPVAKPTFQMLKKGFWAEYTGLGMLHKGKKP